MLGAVVLATASVSLADWTEARCDIYPKGEDKAEKMISCTFGQRQGAVTLTREDGVTHDLMPVGDEPGAYRDQHGYDVRREINERVGLIFRFPEESVYVYWDTSALHPLDEDNPTAPYSTADYDATTLLRCGPVGRTEQGTCPAGILRMEGGQASIVVTSPAGERFTINFLKEVINATNREAEAELEGDIWRVVIDGEEEYEVPLAAIEGG
jgi:hypothetical protein